MSYHSQTSFRAPMDAGRQVAQLRHALKLIEQICGDSPAEGSDLAALQEIAEISTSYADALPIVRRRFDALAAETAAWSATAAEALLSAGSNCSPAAARRLASELRAALDQLRTLLRR